MSYMVEGGGSKTYSKAKKWLYVYPEQSHKLLDCLSNIIVEFLVAQVEAGAQVCGVLKDFSDKFQAFCLSVVDLISF